MQRVPFSRSIRNPRYVHNFLDTCAFDPKYSPEDVAAQKILALWKSRQINIVLTHSNQKEIDHPNTPADVKLEAAAMPYTIQTTLTQDEVARENKIHVVLTGNGRPEKYAADAWHIFEAGKYAGYFITTDQRILDKREELQRVSAGQIFTPSEWLMIFYEEITKN